MDCGSRFGVRRSGRHDLQKRKRPARKSRGLAHCCEREANLLNVPLCIAGEQPYWRHAQDQT